MGTLQYKKQLTLWWMTAMLAFFARPFNVQATKRPEGLHETCFSDIPWNATNKYSCGVSWVPVLPRWQLTTPCANEVS